MGKVRHKYTNKDAETHLQTKCLVRLDVLRSAIT